ncbi:phosphopyruvate hydratase [Methanobacterium petrolearium]|uniref:phosphopyruvate hydratase n=1 Tax=Methanobacterium petrolearium TaxID=710190 RepID=UPI001AE4DAA5|nr:enolase [Methanobacterium petrolearium]
MSSAIENIEIRKILDSRGNATVEIDITTESGFGRVAAPSGASTGALEVVAFPEAGIDKLINAFPERVKPELVGINAEEIVLVDDILKKIDGTDNLSSLGGNVTVAISLAVAKAAASSHDIPLYLFLGGKLKNEIPYPLGNMINGGAHAGKNAPDIQEFLVVPVGAQNISEAVFANSSVHKRIGELIKVKDTRFTGGKGDEGGWAPNLSNYDALNIQSRACEEISDETGINVRPSLDLAPSALWDGSKYVYSREGVSRDTGEQIEFIEEIIDTYKMFFVEDPLREDDFEGFSELTRKVGDKCIICGDDIFVTNSNILSEGIARGAANAIIIKPNQIGTLSDTYQTVQLAKNNNYIPVVSHRSGETTDETIAHLAVAFGAPLIKTGAIGGERIAKLNELIRIEEQMTDPKMATF